MKKINKSYFGYPVLSAVLLFSVYKLFVLFEKTFEPFLLSYATILVGLFGGVVFAYIKNNLDRQKIEIINARKEIEEKKMHLKASESETLNLKKIASTIPLPLYLKDRNYKYLLINPQFEKLCGKPRQEIENQTDYEVFPDPIAELFREQDNEVFSKGTAQIYEETIPLPVGTFTFETFKFPLRNEKGKIYAVGGICTNITKLKKTEDKLRSQNLQLETTINQVGVGVITCGPDGLVTSINKTAADLLSISRKHSEGKPLTKILRMNEIDSGNSLSLDPFDGTWKPESIISSKVIFENRDGFKATLFQKLIPLVDTFGQVNGLLLILNPKDANRGEEIFESIAKVDSPNFYEPEKSFKILLMDDDPLVRKTTTLMLKRGGYECDSTQNGEEAIRKYRQKLEADDPYDAVIMDLTVQGGMGGAEATEEILKLDPEARIMVASGYSNNPVLAQFSEYGFLARMDKPFVLNKLMKAIHELLTK